MTDPSVYIDRGGILLKPNVNTVREAEGILNPAVAGDYLLYRAVAKNNFSRIKIAKLFTQQKDGVTIIKANKLNQVVLEPETDYEMVSPTSGGVEDPRITQLPDNSFVMYYTGYGKPKGFTHQSPTVAAATSQDGLTWHRLGRISFTDHFHQGKRIDFNIIANKDTVLFSEKVNGNYAMLHRPMFTRDQAHKLAVPWRAIWYAEANTLTGPWSNHKIVLEPKYKWENGSVGAGVPPIHLQDSWVHVYHGYTRKGDNNHYSAGVFITPHSNPHHVMYRTTCAVLQPKLVIEQKGIVPHVVFPTAVWPFSDNQTELGIFWGAADTRIMWGVLHLPSAVIDASKTHEHNS